MTWINPHRRALLEAEASELRFGLGLRAEGAGKLWPLILLLGLLALLFGFLQLPNLLLRTPLVPDHTSYLEQVEIRLGDNAPYLGHLPMTWSPQVPGQTIEFLATFEGKALAAQEPVLFIPAIRRKTEVWLNGTRLIPFGVGALSDQRGGGYFIASLPRDVMQTGQNQIRIVQGGEDGLFTGYLGQIQLAEASGIGSGLRTSDFLTQQWGDMTLALGLVLSFALTILTLLRGPEVVTGWLCVLIWISVINILMRHEDVMALHRMMPLGSHFFQMLAAISAVGLVTSLMPGVAQRSLVLGFGGVLALWLLCAVTGVISPRLLAMLTSLLTLLFLSYATYRFALGFCRDGDWMKAVMFLAFGLNILCGLHDFTLAVFGRGGPFMLLSYARGISILAVGAILTGLLVKSLDRLDRVNGYLSQRLQEREDELAILHEREREQASLQALAEERKKLTLDLHEGLSGQLNSIIAMAGMVETPRSHIEATAREALQELRLVLQSLDMEDGDLRAVLAGWREGLEPQLRRLGVKLDWSSDGLPAMPGLGPGGALAILRILQEAVSNALRHGPARHIAILMTSGPRGGVWIKIINDGSAGAAALDPREPRGQGLGAMQSRIEQLGGSFTLNLFEAGGARVTLWLPPTLTSF